MCECAVVFFGKMIESWLLLGLESGIMAVLIMAFIFIDHASQSHSTVLTTVGQAEAQYIRQPKMAKCVPFTLHL